MTVDELKRLQRAHDRAAARAEEARIARNAALVALADSVSLSELARITGLSRSRVDQLVPPRPKTEAQA